MNLAENPIGELLGSWLPAFAKHDAQLSTLPGESGIVASLTNAVGWVRRGNDHLTSQVKRYGSVYRHSFLSVGPVVCVADADAMAAITRDEEGVWSAEEGYKVFFDGIDPGKDSLGIIGFDGERHKDARRLLQPAFGPQALAGYLETATLHYERAVSDWLARGKVAFGPAVRLLFANVANRIFMGVDDLEEAAKLDRALKHFWEGAIALRKNPRLSRAWRNAMHGHRTLRENLQSQVQARRTGNGKDLFSRMCQVGHELPWVDDDMLVRLFIGVITAAFDSTSHGTASMAYLLAKHPGWQERLRAQSRSVAPGKIGYEDLRLLEQYEWVWKETLRMYPVAGMVPRRAKRDVEVAGRRLPKGTLVFGLIAPILHDARWWTAPHNFDPERFSPERAEDKRYRGAFLPFGAGAHTCIGLQLASVEIKAFWHTLLTRARIRLARPYEPQHQFRPLGAVSGDVDLIIEPL